MKPTQRDSYESLWNALHEIELAAVFLPTFEVTHDGGIEAVTKNIVDAIKKAVVALERGGAGGGEPVNQWRKAGTSQWWDGFPDHSDVGGPYETRTLYTRPFPTDLRDAYYKGFMASGEGWNGEHPFQDGSKDPRLDGRWCQTRDNAIEALKGKQ